VSGSTRGRFGPRLGRLHARRGGYSWFHFPIGILWISALATVRARSGGDGLFSRLGSRLKFGRVGVWVRSSGCVLFSRLGVLTVFRRRSRRPVAWAWRYRDERLRILKSLTISTLRDQCRKDRSIASRFGCVQMAHLREWRSLDDGGSGGVFILGPLATVRRCSA
jgi:hypothetical protein